MILLAENSSVWILAWWIDTVLRLALHPLLVFAVKFMHQEWNFKSGTEHLCIGTPSLHHSCLYIWLSSSNWVICPSGHLPERLFLPPNHSDISFFYWFVSQRVKQSQMHIKPKSLSLELTLLASRRLNTWETLFLLQLAYQSWYDYAELAAFCPWRTFAFFLLFFLVALLLRLSSAACSLDRCQEEMVED